MTEKCKMNQLSNSFSLLELDAGDDGEVTIVRDQQENGNGRGKHGPKLLIQKSKTVPKPPPSFDPFHCVTILHGTQSPIN